MSTTISPHLPFDLFSPLFQHVQKPLVEGARVFLPRSLSRSTSPLAPSHARTAARMATSSGGGGYTPPLLTVEEYAARFFLKFLKVRVVRASACACVFCVCASCACVSVRVRARGAHSLRLWYTPSPPQATLQRESKPPLPLQSKPSFSTQSDAQYHIVTLLSFGAGGLRHWAYQRVREKPALGAVGREQRGGEPPPGQRAPDGPVAQGVFRPRPA